MVQPKAMALTSSGSIAPTKKMKSSPNGSPTLSPSLVGPLHLAGKRAIAVMYSYYPGDPRPRRAAEALVSEGVGVEVICLKETEQQLERESFCGVEITRIPVKHRRAGKLTYLAQYGSFILISAAILARRALKRQYNLVHVHNMPDVLVFSALVPKLLGAKVILDLHDPMPELMATIFGTRENSSSIWLLKKLEKWSVRFADKVITCSEPWKQIFLRRGCLPDKITVIMNSPDEKIFRHREPRRQNPRIRDGSKPFVIMYHGALVERHGLDLAVFAMQKIRKTIPNAELRIYGRNTPFLEQVLNLVRQLDLSAAVRYLGPQNLEQISDAISECDVGIIPNRRSKFTELNTPTRIFEFLSQAKPVIAPKSSGVLQYFGTKELVHFELGNADDLAAKIEYVFANPEECAKIIQRGQAACLKYKWSSERIRFVRLADRLLSET
jgi:glycosyltransferase involved in cell wall biosynthesis